MKEGTLFKGETMPKILLTSIIAMFAIMPVFAETAKSEDGGLTCDASGVGATTANARMKASWTPNKYTLQWYDDDNSSTPLTVQSAAQTCNYGANLVLPSTNPPKLGYTFIGWELGQASQICSAIGNGINSYSYYNESDSTTCCIDTSCSADNCNNYPSYFSDLTSKQWKVTFDYGTVYGEAWSNDSDDNPPPYEGSRKFYCWCRITEYSGTTTCSINTPSDWINVEDHIYTDQECLKECTSDVKTRFYNRARLYGSQRCSSLNLNSSIDGTSKACVDISPNGSCKNDNLDTNAASYGLQGGQWAVTFNYGTVFGEGLCSTSSDANSVYNIPGQNCWCKATGYTPNNDDQCISSRGWNWTASPADVYNSTESCQQGCTSSCAKSAQSVSAFRSSIFGNMEPY